MISLREDEILHNGFISYDTCFHKFTDAIQFPVSKIKKCFVKLKEVQIHAYLIESDYMDNIVWIIDL